MYSLLQARNQSKYLVLQVLLLGTSGFFMEKSVEILVEEKHVFLESFALESIIFLAIWFSLDWAICSTLKFKSFVQSFMDRRIAKRGLSTLAVAWLIAALFFKFYSFALEFSAMLALWLILDFLGSKVSRNREYDR